MVRTVITCLLWATLTSGAMALDKGSQLDSLFRYYNENGMFNGVVLAAEEDTILYEVAFGFSDFEKKAPLELSSVFCVASVTKPFTAVAIMMLKEKGLLSYQDKLSVYFPEFPEYSQNVTIENLLLQTSGVVDYLGRGLRLQYELPSVTSDIVIDTLSKQTSLKFNPGDKYSYSNSNYVLLARIIEKVSGQTYKQFIEENIFGRLEMKNSYVRDETMESIPESVSSYEYYWNKDDSDMKIRTCGDGNIYSTVHDLFLFDQALYTGKLVSQSTIHEAYYPPDPVDTSSSYKYGFGWKIPRNSAHMIVYHNGSVAGFRSHFWRNIDAKSTLIILTNNWWLSEIPEIIDGAEKVMNGEQSALAPISIQALFLDNWYIHGFDAAMAIMKKSIRLDSSSYDLSEPLINDLGYFFLYGKEDPGRALQLFKLNAGLYPNSYNVYDSQGDGYLSVGDTANAIVSYREALARDSTCKTSREALKKLGVIIE